MFTFTRFHPSMSRNDEFNSLNANFAQIENQSAKSEGVWREWKPTVVGFTTPPSTAVYRYTRIGNSITAIVAMPSSATSNSTSLTISAPVQAANITGARWEVIARTVDNGASIAYGIAFIDANSSTITVYPYSGTTTWTASGQKRIVSLSLTYEAKA